MAMIHIAIKERSTAIPPTGWRRSATKNTRFKITSDMARRVYPDLFAERMKDGFLSEWRIHLRAPFGILPSNLISVALNVIAIPSAFG
jgi:hypothetical protein